MNLLLSICAALVLALGPAPAMAAWDDTNVAQIIDDVQAVKDKLLDGDIPETAADLKRQLTLLQSQGLLLTETVPEILEWLQQRRTPLREFLRTPTQDHSCTVGAGSTCANFRARLATFAHDFAELRSRFAVIDRLGLGDGGFGAGFVEHAPGFVLFGLHEILDRIPDWELIPGDLADIYDQVGDGQAFSIDWREDGIASARAPQAQPPAATTQTPTERFCEARASRVEEPIDPVRLNRIKMGVAVLKTVLAAVAEFMPDQLGADVLGEGACCVKMPFGATLKAVASAIEIIAGTIDTFQANLAICRGRTQEVENREREIELHLASCVLLVEYKMQGANDAVYSFVEKKIEASRNLLRTARAERYLVSAAASRGDQDWSEAYRAMCRAYQNLGR